MSGSLIVPGMIPGTDIDATEISASATSYRTTSTSIGTSADAVLTSWSGLSASYTAPESPTLLAAMDPAGVDAHLIADKLSRSADLLDDLASAVVAPVRRLKELKTEAEDFVASVRNGVTVDYYDPDNTLNQANQMSGTPVYIPEGEGEQTLDWSEHTPSVNRNNELLEQVAAEVAKLSAACATCVNGINALRDDMCVAPQQAVTAEQILASDELPWGATGKGNRSCNESIGDGIFEFGKSVVGGGAALLGFDIDHDWAHSGDFAAQAWTGLASGLGALVVTVVPPASVLLSLPTSITPEWAHGAQDWYQGTMRGMVEGIVGTPEQWEEDPVAAGTYAVLSIGTFFIPGAGQAGAGVKVAGVLARAGVAAERIAVIAADGSRLANGLVRAGTVFERLSVAVDGLTGVSRSVRGLDDVAHALDEIPDVVPDNLTPRVGAEHPHADVHIDNGDAVPLERGARDGSSSNGSERTSAATETRGGGVSVLERTDTGGGSTGHGGDATGHDGGPTGHDGTASDGDGLDRADSDDTSGRTLPTPEEVQQAVDAENARENAASFADRVADVHDRYPLVTDAEARSIANYERLIDSGRYEPYVVRFFEGSIFNLENAHRYTANEVYLDVGGKHNAARLDSYTPGEAVVSRKQTQLFEQPRSAMTALREISTKYQAEDSRVIIADTPGNRAIFPPEQIGRPLDGTMLLEVPVQLGPVPPRVLELADELDIAIVDVTGRRYS